MRGLHHVVELLFERFAWAEDPDDLVAELQTGSYGDPVPYVASYLTHPDEYRRTYALHALMYIDSERAIDYAIPLLSDPEWVFTICRWFAEVGTERTVEPLVEVLRSSPSPDDRFMAAVALRNTGDARAIPALEHARDHDDGRDHDNHPIRGMAVEAIEAIKAKS